MPTSISKPNSSDLPSKHGIATCLGSVLALFVYYLSHGTTFDEGQLQEAMQFTLLLCLIAIKLIVYSLQPFGFRFKSLALLTALYITSALSHLMSSGISGEARNNIGPQSHDGVINA
jgi:hypothetical protein